MLGSSKAKGEEVTPLDIIRELELLAESTGFPFHVNMCVLCDARAHPDREAQQHAAGCLWLEIQKIEAKA